MRRITPKVRLLSLALVLLVGACSGGDSDDASAASGTEVSPTDSAQDERRGGGRRWQGPREVPRL